MNVPRSLLIKNGMVVTAEGEKSSDILIRDHVIETICPSGHLTIQNATIDETIDASGVLIFPGLIDCHVHFREPGLEHKETMATGMAAALAGGVTTVCDMPNTIPPTVTVAALADKIRRANGINSAEGGPGSRRFKSPATHGAVSEFIPVDVCFFFGATEPQHLIAFREIWLGEDVNLHQLRARCCGLKLYLDHSTGDQKAPQGVIEEAFKLCADLGIVVVCHCEDAEMNRVKSEKLKVKNDVAVHSLMRPPESEARSVEYALGLAKKYGTHFHVAHLSTKQGINLVRAAKQSGVNVTCEVAPHHLFLTIDDYASLGTLAKMNPPLRTPEHQQALWEGIEDGTVDCISTDHAPHTLSEKQTENPLDAPSGVSGVETMVPLLMSVAAGNWPHPLESEKRKMKSDRKNSSLFSFNFSLFTSHIVRLCFENPNRIFGLGKQGIKEGAPADLILVDPKTEWTIRGKELHSKCGWSPYDGWKVSGKILRSIQH